ncbi:MAG: hypothetical protein ABIH34_07200 [Nanoarchaeota archaeon]
MSDNPPEESLPTVMIGGQDIEYDPTKQYGVIINNVYVSGELPSLMTAIFEDSSPEGVAKVTQFTTKVMQSQIVQYGDMIGAIAKCAKPDIVADVKEIAKVEAAIDQAKTRIEGLENTLGVINKLKGTFNPGT